MFLTPQRFVFAVIFTAACITVYCSRYHVIFGYSSILFQVISFSILLEITYIILPKIIKAQTDETFLEAWSFYNSQ